jgi:hypothetical protein
MNKYFIFLSKPNVFFTRIFIVLFTLLTVMPLSADLLFNGDFEYGLGGWYYGAWWGGEYAFEPAYESYTGDMCASIICSSQAEKAGYNTSFKCVPGHTYTISLWYKSDAPDVLGELLADMQYKNFLTAQPYWQQFTYTFTVNSEESTMWIYHEGEAGTTIYYDHILVQEGSSIVDEPAFNEEVCVGVPTKVTTGNHVTLIDGCPFFPISAFGKYSIQEAKDANYNCFLSFSPYSVDFLDNAYAADLPVIVPGMGNMLRGHLPERVGKYATLFMHHPATLAHYVVDEPDHSVWYVPPEECHIAHDMLSIVDPYNPDVVLQMEWSLGINDDYDFSGTSDIVACDPYPFDFNLGVSAYKVTMDKQQAYPANANKPVWWAIEGNWEENPHLTREEQFAAVYASIANNVNGLFYFDYPSIAHDPEQFQASIDAAAEILHIEGALTSTISTLPDRTDDVDWYSREGAGGLYIFSCNTLDASNNNVTLSHPDIMSSSVVYDVFDDTYLTPATGSITDDYTFYERHVYVVDPVPHLCLVGPGNNATDVNVDTKIRIMAIDEINGINASTISMTVEGYSVTPDVTVDDFGGVRVVYDPQGLPTGTIDVSFSVETNLGQQLSHQWSFTTTNDAVEQPEVSITSPTSGAQYYEFPTDVTITADASDPDGYVTLVEFYHNADKIGESSSSPYEITWYGVDWGEYMVTAIARDNEGGVGVSNTILIRMGLFPENLALNQPTAASSTSGGNIAAYAVDENLYSRWESVTEMPQWIYVDLGSNQAVNYFEVKWESAYAAAYDIQVSTDATNWNTIWSGSDLTAMEMGRTDYIQTETSSGRYVRLYITEAWAEGWAVSIWELLVGYVVSGANIPPNVSITSPTNESELTQGSNINMIADASDLNGEITLVEFYQGATKLGEDATSPYSISWMNIAAGSYFLTAVATDDDDASRTSSSVNIKVTTSGAQNLALSRPVTVSSTEADYGNVAANAVDGNTSTRWACGTDGGDTQWIYVDLGSVQSVDEVTLNWEAAFASGYQIQVSNDASNWADVYSTNTGDGSMDFIGFSEVSARYVRMYATVRGSMHRYSLWEFEVYGGTATFPYISITSPEDGDTFESNPNITITANASDPDGSVTRVQFYQGSTSLNVDTASPYSYTWNNVADGDYALTAVVTDNENQSTTSSVVNISVGNDAPSITITSPSDGATYEAPASITINATASDTDGSVTQVQFYQGSTSLGVDTSSPYSVTWNNVAASSYALTAVATDNVGASTTSSTVNITVGDNTPPTVSITSPASGATFDPPASITINATASDADGNITQVQFYQGSVSLGIDTSSPYSASWTNVAAGVYALTAVATDNEGASTTSTPAINITVNGSTPTGNLALSQPVTASSSESGLPASNAVDGSTESRWSSASNGTQWIYVELAATYTIDHVILEWEYAHSTEYQIQVSSDASNWINVYSTTSGDGGTDDITFTAANARYVRIYSTVGRTTEWNISMFELEVYGMSGSNTPPTVSITSPEQSATYDEPVNVTITADAADTDGTIAQVQFYQGSTSLAIDTSSPYSYTWTSVGAGNYALTAVATDDDGATTTSTPAVNITVNANQAPTVSITSPSTGATYDEPASVTINATASDVDGSIAQVQFYQGSTSLGVDTSSPFSYTWTSVAEGSYALTAVATDDDGASTASTPAINITVNSATPTSNLALSRPVTASSSESGLPASNAVDGSAGTRWSSDGNGTQWIYVELAATYSINHVILNWEYARSTVYDIEVSTDASNWTSVYSTSSGDGGIDDITFTAASARYVRVYSTMGIDPDWNISLLEFEVYYSGSSKAVVSQETSTQVIETFVLSQNCPNPFNPDTRISYQLSYPGHVNLVVYNANGQMITTLVSGKHQAGLYNVMWDGRNQSGSLESSGVYFYRLDVKHDQGRFTDIKKMIFVK